jgi:hypothetical protein
MTQQRPGPFMPALVGGAAAGVLTSIPFLGCFCCLWIIGGAMLSAHLYAKNSPASLTSGDGAIVGIFAGIVAAVVTSVLSLPLQAINREFARKFMDQVSQWFQKMPSEWDAWLQRSARGTTLAMFLFGLVVSAAVFAVFGALGGVIGTSLFGKKKTPPPQGAPPVQGVRDETPQNPSDRQP